MTHLFESVRHLGQDAGGFAPALEILLRVTLLLLLAVMAVLLLRRSSAALKHLVWALSLTGALLVPLFYGAFPTWRLAILPADNESPPVAANFAAKNTHNAAIPPSTNPPPTMPREFSRDFADRTAGTPAPSKISPPSGQTAPATGKSSAAVDFRPVWSWTRGLAALWALGTLSGLVWTSIGIAGAWLVVRRSKPAADARWRLLLGKLLDRYRFARPVEIRECPQIPVPMTWGIRRPVILVPAKSDAWSEETKRSVLLHELGHIRRRDCLVHLLGRLACAAYWFHPLVWLAAKQLRKTSEQAADDAVLASPIAPPDYAEHLLHVAGQMRGIKWFGHVALPMASPSDLKGRVQAILDSDRNHRSIKRKTCYALMILAMLLLIPCALLRPSSVRAADEGKPVTPAKPAAADKSPDAAKKPNEPVKEEQAEPILKMNLQALDAETGKPLADVPITIRVFHPQPRKIDQDVKKTDAEGKANCEIRSNLSKIGDLTLPVRPAGSELLKIGDLSIQVRPAGYVPQYYSWEPAKAPLAIPSQLTMRFRKGITVGGQIQDASGKPIADAKVEVLMPATNGHGGFFFHLGNLKTDREGRWQCDVAPDDLSTVHISVEHPDFLRVSANATSAMKEKNHVLRLEQGVTVRGQVLDAQGQPVNGAEVNMGRIWANQIDPQAKTDAQGEFVLKNCTLGPTAVTVQAEGFAPQCQKITVAKENPPLTFRLEPGATLRGRVVDRQGKPLEGIGVYPDTWQDLRTLNFRTTTDKEGRFVWKNAPRDTVVFSLSGKGFISDRNRPLTASDEEQTITLQPELVIRGTVVDEETGKPVAKFQFCTGFRRDTEQQAFFNNQFVSGENGRFEYHLDEGSMPNNFLKVTAEGYNPAVSRAFKPTEGEQSFEFKMKKGKGLGGVVLLPDGKPAENATVALVSKSSHPFIQNGEMSPSSSGIKTLTDAGGRFSFVPQTESCSFIALHKSGYAEISQSELEKAGTVMLQPWGRLEGVVKIGSQLAKKTAVLYQSNRSANEQTWSRHYETTTDDEGRFSFDRVFPGKGSASRVVIVANGMTQAHAPTNPAPVEILPGKTAKVEIGGKGRPVAGRIDTGGKITEWTDVGSLRAKYRIPDEFYDNYSFKVEADGSFRIDDVAAGKYEIDLRIREPHPLNSRGGSSPFGNETPLGQVNYDFTVPEMPDGQDEEPLDLGTIKATLYKILQPGDPAPTFTAETLDGKKFSLAEQRGKIVLISFWASWQGPAQINLPELKKVFERFHDNPKFAMIGLAQDQRKEITAKFIEKETISWPQSLIGVNFESGAAADFGVRGTATVFLVGGDGKIIAKDLHGAELEAAVEKALKP